MTAWIEHIKDFAKRNGITYGCALSNPDCSAEYHAKRPPKLNKKEKKELGGMKAQDINVAKKYNLDKIREEVSFLPPRSTKQIEEMRQFREIMSKPDGVAKLKQAFANANKKVDKPKKLKKPKKTKEQEKQEKQENIKKWKEYEDQMNTIADLIRRKYDYFRNSNIGDILRYFRNRSNWDSWSQWIGTKEYKLYEELEKLLDKQNEIPTYLYI